MNALPFQIYDEKRRKEKVIIENAIQRAAG